MLQDGHGLLVGDAFQALAVHSQNLVATLQAAIVGCSALQADVGLRQVGTRDWQGKVQPWLTVTTGQC